MNALVKTQGNKYRILGSRDVMDAHFGGNRIFLAVIQRN